MRLLFEGQTATLHFEAITNVPKDTLEGRKLSNRRVGRPCGIQLTHQRQQPKGEEVVIIQSKALIEKLLQMQRVLFFADDIVKPFNSIY